MTGHLSIFLTTLKNVSLVLLEISGLLLDTLTAANKFSLRNSGSLL